VITLAKIASSGAGALLGRAGVGPKSLQHNLKGTHLSLRQGPSSKENYRLPAKGRTLKKRLSLGRAQYGGVVREQRGKGLKDNKTWS